MRKWTGGALALLVAAGGFGCDEDAVNDLLSGVFPKQGKRELSDDDAFKHLRVNRQEAPETDVQAVMKTIDHEVAREMGAPMTMMMDADVVALQRKTVHARLNLKTNDKDLIPIFELAEDELDLGMQEKRNCAFEVDLGELNDEFLIPNVDKIPVRDQGYRGTCASFAGIGTLEYAALNPNTDGANPDLPTLDLSEQYFYFNSKPECQDGSCTCPGCAEGSWYGKGFDASVEAPDALDIPLETDCPYNNKPGDNDTQAPMLGSCDSGAVSVTEMSDWCGLDDLVDLLHAGYAIPYASPLSSGWERNDGLITGKEIGGGDTVHAGGHAYLIVGYRKLPEMPDEGGMCFVVKNSWGTGWGINGYSCQTLDWMRKVTFEGFIQYGQPIPSGIKLSEELDKSDELPPDNEEAEDEVPPDVPDELDDEDFDDADFVDEEDDPAEQEELEPTPAPEPEPEPEPDPTPVEEYVEVKLWGPNETFYRVEVYDGGEEVKIVGVLRGDAGKSRILKLRKSGKHLMFDGDIVGALEGDVMRVCTQEWGALCSLRYRASDKTLYVQFRDDDLRAVQASETSEERGEWFDVSLGGADFGFFLPNIDDPAFIANPKTFVRLGGSEPARLTLRPEGSITSGAFDVKITGQRVGSLRVLDPTNSTLCSGEDRDKCNVAVDERLHIVPRNEGLPIFPRD